MQQLSDQQKKEIIEVLDKKGVRLPCPRCGNREFLLVDGYFNQTIQTDLNGLIIGGPSIPTVATVCNNCGYLSQHAIGVLGLLPKKEAK